MVRSADSPSLVDIRLDLREQLVAARELVDGPDTLEEIELNSPPVKVTGEVDQVSLDFLGWIAEGGAGPNVAGGWPGICLSV